MENALKIFSVIMVIIVVAAAISMLPEQVDNFVGQESDVCEASYIIYKDGDYTCAKNGTTGRIEMRSENDRNVIQYSLDKLNGIGGNVFISNGHYTISKQIQLYSNCNLIGAGQSKTVLEYEGHTAAALTSNANSGQPNIVVSDASQFEAQMIVAIIDSAHYSSYWVDSVVGNTVTLTTNLHDSYTVAAGAALWPFGPVVFGASVSNVTINNLEIDGNADNQMAYNPTFAYPVGYGVIYECDSGIYFENNSMNIVVDSTYVHDTLGHGVSFWNSKNIVVKDSKFFDIGDKGILHFSTDIEHGNLTFINNVIINTGLTPNKVTSANTYGDGIQIDDTCSNARISNNHIENTRRTGIISVAWHSIISENLVRNANMVTKNYPSISVRNSDNIVSNNQIENGGANGIYVLGDNVTISGNSVNTVLYSGIEVDGDWCSVSGNNVINARYNGLLINSHNNSINGNLLNGCGWYNPGSYAGIRLKGDYNTVTANTFKNENGLARYHMVVESGANYNQIVSNDFSSAPAISKLSNSGTGNVIKYNAGYVKENYGTATMTSGTTYVNVAHGLLTNPTCVIVTSKTGATYTFYITDIGPTYFKINAGSAVSGNQEIYWYAAC